MQSGYPYVTPIRLQGGIPRYSLPDFFEYIGLPSVEDPNLLLLDDRTAFEEVQERSEAQYRVDQVVKLYMEHGGEYAFNFFARTRNLAKIAVKKGEVIPSPSELNLRPYVVQLFEEYLEKRVEKKTRRRLHSPRLTFWPHQSTFHLELPEQTIPEGYAYRQHEWRIRLYEGKEIKKEESYSARVFRKGREIRSEGIEITIEYPYQQAIIEYGSLLRAEEKESLEEKYKVIRRWPVRLMPDPEQPPLISFNQEGKIIRHTDGLPAEICWLLMPIDHQINIDGKGRKIEEKSDYWGNWSDWKAELWDLYDVRLVELVDGSGKNVTVLPVLQPLPSPTLLGEKQIAYSQKINESILFIGSPPSIGIPKVGYEEDGREVLDLDEWYLTISSDGPADPKINLRVKFTNHQDQWEDNEDPSCFPLIEILGEYPVGTYEIEINRPDGKIFNQSFRLWPELFIEGLQPLFIPENEEGNIVELVFTLPKNTSLDSEVELDDPQKQIEIKNVADKDEENKFKVTIPPGVRTGEFTLSHHAKPDSISVPLVLSIPRLRWTVRLGNTALQEVEWHSELQHISLPKLTQSEQSILYTATDLPRDTEVNLSLSLILPESGKKLQTLSGEVLTQGEPRCGWNLEKFLDTIRPLESEPFFDLALEVKASHLAEPVQIPVVRLSRAIDVKGIWLQKHVDENWVLHWQEPKPLQHRRIRLWSIWQPWHEPIEIKIPNDAPPSDSVDKNEWYMHELPLEQAPLMLGSYAASFVAIPPWEERTIPEYPPDTGVMVFRTEDPGSRLSWIDDQLSGGSDRAFALHFERACIFDELGQLDKRDDDISWCSSHCEKVSLRLLIKFYSWLEGRDPLTQKALRIRMYQPGWMRKLFSQYDSREFLREYLTPILEMEHIPSESARLILGNVDFPDLVSKAVQQLIHDEDEYVIDYILSQSEKGKFSVLGAFEIMKPCADFALQRLLDLEDSFVRSRLLKELSEHTKTSIIVYPGWWIRSDAGWGRIERIIKREKEEDWEYFRVDQDKPILEITLRPQKHPIPIKVDLSEESIFFPETDDIYLCCHGGSCYHFISTSREDLINIHTRVAHEGLQPSFQLIRKPFYHVRKTIHYEPDPPENTYL